ncbi:mercuric reductase [Candidatus Poribacteria bacterium]|nr:mercuric reductase [Candidatus Poribacteria bacterium]MYH83446.1 mercuric reductase [Candidatus Poribacteria bacterium]MYK94490.1 mercuric reductase [Candidatus Poribacteria bacterium]
MDTYDLTIIGGGSAGLVLAVAGAKLGKKTALVEKHRIGGDCLWTGCVPSKALLKAAKVANYTRNAGKYGIDVQDPIPNWHRVMDYVQGTQHVIEEEHDNPERFREMGVDVIFGDGHFEASDTFVVADTESGETRTLNSKKFVISTGSRPVAPPIPGLASCDYLDSETVWELTEFPERLLVVGAGPIGIELGQAFHRLGADVTIAQRSERILTKEDTDVSEQMLGYLHEEGIAIRLNTNIAQIVQHEDAINVTFSRLHTSPTSDSENGVTEQIFDKILIAAGRAPNVEGLGLEKIGVQVGSRGIEVNNRLQTSVRNIYAAGDVIGHYLFTHVAAFQAQLLLRNIFFPLSNTINYAVVPWTTFCDPEVARCGLTEAEAREKYSDVDVFTLDQNDVDRAVAEGETQGFSKVIASRWTGKILGVHLVGANAGEVVHEYVLAMQQGIPLRKLSGMIHVYPTFSSSVWRVAGKWFSESTLIQTLRKLLP